MLRMRMFDKNSKRVPTVLVEKSERGYQRVKKILRKC